MMGLAELYQIARNMSYKEFREEVDYRMTGQLKTTVSDNHFVLVQGKKK